MAVPVVVSTSRVQPASTTTVTVPLPSGWADGDMMLAVISAATSSQTVTTPSGWTYITNKTRGGFGTSNIYFFYRILTGTESDPSFTISASSAAHLGEGYLIRGQDSATPVTHFADASAGGFTAGITMPTVTTTDNNCLLFFYESKYANSTADHTWTNATEVTDYGYATQKVTSATSSQITAGTTPSNISVTSGGSSSSTALAAVTLAIREAQFALKPDGDTATGTDTAAARAYSPAADTGSGTENATQKVSGAVDSGAGTDNGSVRAYRPGADTAAGTDNAAARVFVPASDVGVATDDALATNTPQSSDAASGTDSASTRIRPTTESGAGTDNAAVRAYRPAPDTAAATDNVTIRVRPTTESGAGTDNAIIRHKPGDTGAGTDNASIKVTVFGSDTASGTDTSKVKTFAGDDATGTDNAFKSISGELQASRLVVVQAESRVVTVDFDGEDLGFTEPLGIIEEDDVIDDYGVIYLGRNRTPRKITVEPEIRLVMVGSEV